MNVFLQLALAGLLTNKNFITRLASAPKRTQNCLKSDGDLCRPVISCNMTERTSSKFLPVQRLNFCAERFT